MRVIYLFGAGASLPASLPGIGKITKDFFTNIIHSNKSLSEIKEHLREKAKVLEKITKESFERFDLETFITLIVDLANNEYKTIFQKNYPDLKNINKEDLQNIKLITYGYIRQKLEGINSEVVTYLSPLLGLIGQNNSLNIFTLNYDGTIEALCEKHAISYSDGFTPYWDPNIFDDPNIKVKILKLHGSLYWLKSASGKVIRVPLKGLEISNVKYFSDESLSEMMIYPALRKEKYSEVYSWLSSKFISELNNSDICVIIGYSFRDKDIRDIVIDSLYKNSKLWLIIISPNASNKKKEYFPSNADFFSRIVSFDTGIEESLTDRRLYSDLSKLDNARNLEEMTWIQQYQEPRRLDFEWSKVIEAYETINHHDRIRDIVERLAKLNYTSHSGIIERRMGMPSISNMIDYYHKDDKEKFRIWMKIFASYCAIVEYSFFKTDDYLKTNNVIEDEEYLIYQSSNITRFDWKGFKREIEQLKVIFNAPASKMPLSKFIETIDLLIENTNEEGRVKHSKASLDIVEKYKSTGLGLTKHICELRGTI